MMTTTILAKPTLKPSLEQQLEKTLDDAFKELNGRPPNDAEWLALEEAAVVFGRVQINTATPKRYQRRWIAAYVYATVPQWREELIRFIEKDVHWAVHCILHASKDNDLLRKHYGNWTPELTPRQIAERAIPIEDIPGVWPMEFFEPGELASRGKLFLTPSLMIFLDRFRREMGRPVLINSGYRTPSHNADVAKSAKGSRHMHGDAVDIDLRNHKGKQARDMVMHLLDEEKIGYAEYGPKAGNFIHVDLRGERKRWRSPVDWPDAQHHEVEARVVTNRKRNVEQSTAATAGAVGTVAATAAVDTHLDWIEAWVAHFDRFVALPGLLSLIVAGTLLYNYWGRVVYWLDQGREALQDGYMKLVGKW